MPWIGLVAAGVGAAGSALAGAGSPTGSMKPWSGVRQPMTAAAKLAEQGLYRGNFQGDRIANMTPGQLAALRSMSALGSQLSPMLGDARGQVSDTLSGQYMENPFTGQAVQAAIQPAIQEYQRVTMPNMMGRSVGGGGIGSSGMEARRRMANEALSSSLANTSAQIGYQNYGDERNRMMGALGYVPGLTEASYLPAQQQYGAQTAVQTQQQREIDSRMGAFNEPFERALRAYSALGGAAMPSQSGGGATTGGMLGQALLGGLGGYSMARGMGYGGGAMGMQQQGQPRPWVNGNW